MDATTRAREIAERLHLTYELLAPEYGWGSQEVSKRTWNGLPQNQRALMLHVVREAVLPIIERELQAALHDTERARGAALTKLAEVEILRRQEHKALQAELTEFKRAEFACQARLIEQRDALQAKFQDAERERVTWQHSSERYQALYEDMTKAVMKLRCQRDTLQAERDAWHHNCQGYKALCEDMAKAVGAEPGQGLITIMRLNHERNALQAEVARLRGIEDIIKPTFEVLGDHWQYMIKDDLYCLFCDARADVHDEGCIVPRLQQALARERT